MSDPRGELERYAKQSEIRVRSGTKLVALLLAVAIASAAFGVWWLAQLSGSVATFFAIVTLFEYWNARRRRRQLSKVDG